MENRRSFFTNLLGISAITLLPLNIWGQEKKTAKKFKITKPKRLKKGDTIGLIAPGYAIKESKVIQAISVLEKMGFKTQYSNRLLQQHGYLSNTDKERANDINEMFGNPDIDAILCARGGYGCTRILHLVDFENIKQNPKILIGFSDITALLNPIYKKTGLVTFHGPVGSTIKDNYSIKQLKKILINPKNNLALKNAKLKDKKERKNAEFERYIITKGKSLGIIVGGSLTLINALIGTPYEIDFTDKIVCIEDVEEAPYRIDRMLTQLIDGPTFKKAAGIVFGVCSGCNHSSNPNSFTLKEVLIDLIKPLKIPAIYGMSFGHTTNNFTFPIGIKAELNADKQSLKLLEKAVT